MLVAGGADFAGSHLCEGSFIILMNDKKTYKK